MIRAVYRGSATGSAGHKVATVASVITHEAAAVASVITHKAAVMTVRALPSFMNGYPSIRVQLRCRQQHTGIGSTAGSYLCL